ncbi:histone-lysine N-methyltransferase EHMT1-like isoform X2 [Actinia tenebrosa]|uniref:Histone-lysine N-methyltransferase EHMT1-like isoform X2 n=1 Tax=Actinia tenebrosa TaxID=6105 RepID=A0A6P8HK47_ACTTE|nr:histone-lysine N-methyltransferase EHMT1-like isoform X2 [Actinia tenebrosa]
MFTGRHFADFNPQEQYLEPIPIHSPSRHMNSSCSSEKNVNFEEAFNRKIEHLLSEKGQSDYNQLKKPSTSSSNLSLSTDYLQTSSPQPFVSVTRKEDKTTKDNSIIEMSVETSLDNDTTDEPVEFSLSVNDELILSDQSLDSSSSNASPSAADNTKNIDVQAGPSMIISINSVPSRFPKRRRSSLDEKNKPPPPKTVKIAPFNRAPSGGSLSFPHETGQPEIGAVADGGKSLICHAVPLTANMISKTRKPPGTEMVSIGKADAFVACIPMSCEGKFTPSQCTIPKQNKCSCKAHIKKQVQGMNKNDPLVIDSDDDDDEEEVTIVNEVRPPSTTNTPTKVISSIDIKTPTTSHSTDIDVTTTNMTTAPNKETPTHTDSQPSALQKEPMATPLSPRHRARLSADFKSHQKPAPQISSQAIRTLDLSTSTQTSIVATKFNDRLKAIERAASSSATSATSAVSESSPSPSSSPSSKPVEHDVVSSPDNLLKMLQEIKRERPYKKLRVTARNLHQAVKNNNLSKVLALLVEGCKPNVQVETEKGRTAVHAAAAGGFLDIITCLKMSGGDLDVLDYDMRTPLFDAVENNRIKTVIYLIDAGASLRVKDQGGMTLLHVAARRGHDEIIRILLDSKKFNINQKDDGGWTAIMWAAEDKMVETAKLLLHRGGNVHLRDLELNIPLHWAAFAGSYQMSLVLLENRSDLHAINRHGETPIHIAARENNYSCVQLFLNRGARIDITNNEGSTPLQVALPETKSRQLIETKKLLLQCQPQPQYRLLSCDISRGQENVAIPCVNEVDDEPFPEFSFVKECCEVGGAGIEWNINTIQACICEGDCGNNPNCSCGKMCDEEVIWYDKEGLLCPEIHKLDRPLVFECNKMCKCWSYCRNRVVQKGMQYPLQLFKTKKKGWGVRALCAIPKGTFLCEYTGELISDAEADTRESDAYLFDLDCKESEHELYCIDGGRYGNISRFINHSCEPNTIPTRAFVDHQDIRFPRIAFFSSKDIDMYEEVCFNYGDRFWEVKKEEFFCQCGTPSCNYKAPNS